jgi:hypothetical protein
MRLTPLPETWGQAYTRPMATPTNLVQAGFMENYLSNYAPVVGIVGVGASAINKSKAISKILGRAHAASHVDVVDDEIMMEPGTRSTNRDMPLDIPVAQWLRYLDIQRFEVFAHPFHPVTRSDERWG